MTTTIDAPRHRADPGDPSPRLDPYAIGNSTYTLEAYRRSQERDRSADATGRRSGDRADASEGVHP